MHSERQLRILACFALGAALFGVTLFAFWAENDFNTLHAIGWLLIIKSVIVAYLFRDEKSLSVLLMIQIIVDVNVAFSVCFHPEDYVNAWQQNLYILPQNVVTAKALLLFSLSLSCGLYFAGPVERRWNQYKPIMSSTLMDIMLILFMMYALLFGLDRGTVGSYSSNSNPAYEYAIVAFIMLWYGSDDNKGIRYFLYAYAAVYICQGLLFGDRSSAFPMLIAVFLLQAKKRPRLIALLAIGLGGIMFSNSIDIFRNSGEINEAFFGEIVDRGFYSNTVSYSFYAGTAITTFRDYVTSGVNYFFDLVFATFLGNSKVNSDLSGLAMKANYSLLFNRGGGFTSSYFYFYFGYLGTVIGGLAIGAVVRKISNRDTLFCNMVTTTLLCFFIRWYVYYPLAMTRTSLLVPAVIYFAYRFLTKRSAEGLERGPEFDAGRSG